MTPEFEVQVWKSETETTDFDEVFVFDNLVDAKKKYNQVTEFEYKRLVLFHDRLGDEGSVLVGEDSRDLSTTCRICGKECTEKGDMICWGTFGKCGHCTMESNR
tara:strand:- start:5727 stop:6038 length:312 start_codon:yes stop_codon:yes gene_type:complete